MTQNFKNSTNPAAPKASNKARFVTGSTMKHIQSMTFASSVGLTAIFLVDFVDIYFLSLLGDTTITAAVGYAGTIIFFLTSVGIGLSIAAGSLVSKVIGAGDETGARRLATNILLVALLVSLVIMVAVLAILPNILDILGAKGQTRQFALTYLYIIVPSMPFLAIGICSMALLRAVADAKHSMLVTLTGAAVNAVFDPLLIFSVGLGLEGAAIATVLARITIFVGGLYWLFVKHDLFESPKVATLKTDSPKVFFIAIPAILTNIASPVGGAIVTVFISSHGDGAMAGWAIINRLIPVSFGVLFALSGAVGPIIGQNLGAQRFDRLRQIMIDAMKFVFWYMIVVWFILAFGRDIVTSIFKLSGTAKEVVAFFCLWLAPFFGFWGLVFIANAAFNNLGKPHYSTLSNWGRATIGAFPLIYFGGLWFGAQGIITGYIFGSVAFGIVTMIVCFRLIKTIEQQGGLKQ